MKTLTRLIFFLVLLVLAGAGIFLMTWDIPAPSSPVEKVLPDDRFPN